MRKIVFMFVLLGAIICGCSGKMAVGYKVSYKVEKNGEVKHEHEEDYITSGITVNNSDGRVRVRR